MEDKKQKAKEYYLEMRRLMAKVESSVVQPSDTEESSPDSTKSAPSTDKTDPYHKVILLLVERSEAVNNAMMQVRGDLALMRAMVSDIHRALMPTYDLVLPIQKWSPEMEVPLRQHMIKAFNLSPTLEERSALFYKFFNPHMFGVMKGQAKLMRPIQILKESWATTSHPVLTEKVLKYYIDSHVGRACLTNRRRLDRHRQQGKPTPKSDASSSSAAAGPVDNDDNVRQNEEDDDSDFHEEKTFLYFEDDPE